MAQMTHVAAAAVLLSLHLPAAGLAQGSGLPVIGTEETQSERLTTMFRQEAGECLSANLIAQNPELNDEVFMDKCMVTTDQFWTFVPAVDGRVTIRAEGGEECLTGSVPFVPAAERPPVDMWAYMTDCSEAPEQLWTLEAAADGYFRLKNLALGDGKCLEGNVFEANAFLGGVPFMDDCR